MRPKNTNTDAFEIKKNSEYGSDEKRYGIVKPHVHQQSKASIADQGIYQPHEQKSNQLVSKQIADEDHHGGVSIIHGIQLYLCQTYLIHHDIQRIFERGIADTPRLMVQ